MRPAAKDFNDASERRAHDCCDRISAARDFLLQHRSDYATAYAGFKWPKLKEFNWALDYFDTLAKGNDNPALWIIEEDGSESKLSFAEMSARSNRVANWLRKQGVKRGERILIMLGNEVPLWETMLAAIKLGAVVIPATTLLTPDDLVDRVERGQVKHVVIGKAHTDKFESLPGNFGRIAVGGAPAGWKAFEEAAAESDQFTPDGVTRVDDPLLLYFTSGTTSKPKLVLHTHQSYPVGHLFDDVLDRPEAQRPPHEHLLAGLGQARLELLLRALERRRLRVPVQLQPLQRQGPARRAGEVRGHHHVRAPDRVAHADPGRTWPLVKTKLRELIGAGEPLNPRGHRAGEEGLGITIRDGFGQTETTARDRQHPRPAAEARLHGPPAARLQDRPARRRQQALGRGRGGAGDRASSRPVGLMVGYAGDAAKTAEVMRDGHYRTGDVASIDDDGATSPTSAAPTTCSRPPTTASAPSSSRAC